MLNQQTKCLERLNKGTSGEEMLNVINTKHAGSKIQQMTVWNTFFLFSPEYPLSQEDNLYGMSKLIFWGKIRKKSINLLTAEFTQ